MIIAIDGPAGSGKGTICGILAKECNLTYIDTGATYRALALKILQNNIDLNDKDAIIDIASKINIKFDKERHTYLDDIDVSSKIRSAEVTKASSTISSIPEVRKYLVEIQRKMALNDNVIIEGRDVTTVVFPNADYKFYLDANLDIRAKRRYEQNVAAHIECNIDEIKRAIKARDYNDMHKEVGSLMRCDDQIYIDSSDKTIDEVVSIIRKEIGR